MFGQNKTGPVYGDIEFRIAENGLYITENTVYTVSQSKKHADERVLRKNNIPKFEGAVMKRGNQLEWDMGRGSTSTIQKYVRQIPRETFMQGMDLIADDLEVEKRSDLKAHMMQLQQFLSSQDATLPELASAKAIPQCPFYKEYSALHFGQAAIYVRVAQMMGVEDQFLNDSRTQKILADMACDHNGVASKLEKKVNEHNKAKY